VFCVSIGFSCVSLLSLSRSSFRCSLVSSTI